MAFEPRGNSVGNGQRLSFWENVPSGETDQKNNPAFKLLKLLGPLFTTVNKEIHVWSGNRYGTTDKYISNIELRSLGYDKYKS